jgi:LmbE family N-acetylglucosaminyl deacetylase
VGGVIPLIVRAGGQATTLIVTDGSSTQYPGQETVLNDKQGHARAAARTLGYECLIQWQFPDMRLDTVPHAELSGALSKLVADGGFDTVFVHHHGDVNRDHREIYLATLVATRPTPACPVKQVLAYEVNSSTEWGARTPDTAFNPNVYVDISETIDLKLDAMDAYAGELREYPHPRSRQAILERARLRGNEVGMTAAEAFELVLMRGSVVVPT